MSMFKDSNARRELALTLLHEFKEYFYPLGQPFNEQNIAMAFRNAFMVTDIFMHVEGIKKEDLPAFGQPQPMVPQHMRPGSNGAPPPRPQAVPAQVTPIKPPDPAAA